MKKLILPLILAFIIATTVMTTPLLFIQAATKEGGGFIMPGSSDAKNTDTASSGTIQTKTGTQTQTLELVNTMVASNLLNVFYMFATCILIASVATFLIVRAQRRPSSIKYYSG